MNDYYFNRDDQEIQMTMAAQKTETEAQAGNKDMKEIVALCKRRGFIFPASEIYGHLNDF